MHTVKIENNIHSQKLSIFQKKSSMIRFTIYFAFIFLIFGCSEDAPQKANVAVSEESPEYKAYTLVQELKLVKEIQSKASEKNQKVMLKLNKDFLNGKDGYYWFQVVQLMGNTDVPKLNVKVFENSFEVKIFDDNSGKNMSPEEYEKLLKN